MDERRTTMSCSFVNWKQDRLSISVLKKKNKQKKQTDPNGCRVKLKNNCLLFSNAEKRTSITQKATLIWSLVVDDHSLGLVFFIVGTCFYVPWQLDLHVSKQGHHLELGSIQTVITNRVLWQKTVIFQGNQTVYLHLKELVDFAEVYPFLCIQLIDVADISIHQVQAKTHDLKHRAIP